MGLLEMGLSGGVVPVRCMGEILREEHRGR